MNTGLAAGNDHVAGRPALTPDDGQQIFAACRAPFIALFSFRQYAEQRHFPIGKLIPGMFGIAPGATNRASL